MDDELTIEGLRRQLFKAETAIRLLPFFPLIKSDARFREDAMKDMQAHLEKLRVQIAECEMIRDLATDKNKRELFAKLAEHHKLLAAEVERAMKDQMPITFLGRKTQEPFPETDE